MYSEMIMELIKLYNENSKIIKASLSMEKVYKDGVWTIILIRTSKDGTGDDIIEEVADIKTSGSLELTYKELARYIIFKGSQV